MLILRATKKLRDKVDGVPAGPEDESTAVLGDWYADLLAWRLRTSRPQAMPTTMCNAERSHSPIERSAQMSLASAIVLVALAAALVAVLVGLRRAANAPSVPGPWLALAVVMTVVAYVVGAIVSIRDDQVPWASAASFVMVPLVLLAGIAAVVTRKRAGGSALAAALAQAAVAVGVAGVAVTLLS